MTLRRSLALLLLSLVALVASVVSYRSGAMPGGGSSPVRTASGVQPAPLELGPSDWLAIPAPDGPFFTTLEGEPARLSDYRGRVVLLNFWGTWCPPCRVEIPHLVRAQAKLEALGATIIAPAVGSGAPEEILAFAGEAGINYPIWIVSDAVAAGKFGAPGYPFTMLIGPDGVIRRTYIGPQTEEILLRDAEELLSVEEAPPAAG
ncbi:MAG: TlpA disulfide reductase family protein [Gemmatimonadota bacterium]